jgi:MFS family permease
MLPSPADTPDVEQYVARHYRWNFTVNALDGAFFWFGMTFIASSTILPLFASHLTTSLLLIGLIPLIDTAGTLIPQLFVANWVERRPRKLWFPAGLGFFTERMPVFLLAPLMYLLLRANQPVLALVSFYLLYTWKSFGGGIIIIGWQDMIAKIIPLDKRGRFFGITNFIGSAAGILGALAVAAVLARYPFPIGFVLSFAAAAVMVFLSWIFLSQAREPAVASSKPPVSQLEYLRSLPSVVRRDYNFRAYLLAQIVFAISLMATGFLVVYTARTWQLSDAQGGAFTIALQVGMTLAYLFFGFFSDRWGHKLSLEIGFLLNALSLGLAIVAPSPLWFYAIFFLRGAISAASFVSGISIVYEFTDADNRGTYIGLANTLPGVVGAISPLIGGWLAGAVSYQAMFVLATATGGLAWGLMRFAVREPRKVAAAAAGSRAAPTVDTAA